MQELRAGGKPAVITVSTLTIFKIVILALGLAFLYLIRDIIALFFVSLVLASVINPLASWFEAKGLRRWVGALFLYAVILSLIVFVAVSLIPAVASETRDLVGNADAIWGRFLDTLGPLRGLVASQGLGDSLSQLLSGNSLGGLTAAAGGLVATIRGLFAGLVSMLAVFVVTFYLVVSDDALKRLFRNVAPEAYQPYLVDLFSRMEKAIGYWVRGQLILSLVVAVTVYVMLSILGVKYALILAVTAGLFESIPFIGPVIAAVPAVLIAMTNSLMLGLLTAAAYLVMQQTENHILVPKIMQKTTGLHPIVSIFSLLIGAKVAGLIGALLAIPVATAVGIIVGDLFRMVKTHR